MVTDIIMGTCWVEEPHSEPRMILAIPDCATVNYRDYATVVKNMERLLLLYLHRRNDLFPNPLDNGWAVKFYMVSFYVCSFRT